MQHITAKSLLVAAVAGLLHANASLGVIVQLTQNNVDDLEPSLWGTQIVWQQHDGNDAETILQNGLSFGDPQTVLTNDSFHDTEPSLNGSVAAWQSWDGTDWEIHTWNGSSVVALTNDVNSDVNPNVSGDGNNIVVWERWDGTDTEVMINSGGGNVALTANSGADAEPSVYGASVVWQSSSTSAPTASITDFDVMLYDGSSTTNLTSSQSTTNHTNAAIFGSNVIWQGWDGNDWEIFLYNGSTISRLTNNSVDEVNAVISGNYIAWEGFDGNDTEIFRYSISSGTTEQITNNLAADGLPTLAGQTLAWHGNEDGDWEIYVLGTTAAAVPLPAAFWAGLALMSGMGVARYRRNRDEEV